MKKLLLLMITTVIVVSGFSQTTFPANGVADDREKMYAFTHATLIVDANTTLTDATLLIKDGKIVAAGNAVTIPGDAVVIDATGKFIYPSFIDLDAAYGIPAKENPDAGRGPQMLNNNKNASNWNQAVTPEFTAYAVFTTDTAAAAKWRSAGFGAGLTHRHDGILRGTGAFVLLGNDGSGKMLMRENVSSHYSFMKGSSSQDYPSSQMGSIALIRQTLYDAAWYAKGGDKIEKNISLEAINKNKSLVQVFDSNEKLEILRADKIGDEFAFQFVVKGSGNEYQRTAEIKASRAALIIPLNYPKTPDVSDPYDAELLSLSDLKHWEMAPANCAMLEDAGIKFSLTSSGLENKSDFLPAVRKAVKYGLSEKTALQAMTTVPAEMIKMQNEIGSLSAGKMANFIITSGNIFKDETVIYENWVNGTKYRVQNAPEDARGIYKLTVGNRVYGLQISGKLGSPEFAVIKNTDTIKASGNITDATISISFSDGVEMFRLSGWKNAKQFGGSGQINSNWVNWTAEFTNVYAEKIIDKKQDSIRVGQVMYPFTAYGNIQAPKQQEILITNTTVWTNEKDGVLKNYDVLISNGKIIKIGKNISAKNAVVIDGTNKHLTAGIIDEHSHIAVTSGVNEGTQSISAEVRIGDVINCDDVNIYRQLSGGVTSSHILHGSANAVGGQTQLIKLRWGAAPEQMKFEGADGFIKFALGENVKQSNWGDESTVRFPQSRMGVEQVFEDAFTRAEAYIAAKNASPESVRIDLELEALAEILQEKRFITCHSYVQSEINMLMKVAERHDFTVNTFTHILEGYKVADKMKMHGAGASSFSDWWAYKYEVAEAIPQNPGIMLQEGVITAINSDDAEMARRLNQEAAKSIKYAGMSEEDALKMVTLNPAILLHVDDRVGSIKEGKDADVVLWSDNPLSIYAIVEKTIIDGIVYYDYSLQSAIVEGAEKERSRIIAKMIAEKTGGGPVVPIVVKENKQYDCEDIGDYVSGE
jgi:imidazolonepropionase-like amidohydrolase